MSVLGALLAPPAVAAFLIALVLLAVLAGPGPADAAGVREISEAEAIESANRDPKVVGKRRENGALAPVANEVDGNWEVAYFAAGDEVALVIVDPGRGR